MKHFLFALWTFVAMLSLGCSDKISEPITPVQVEPADSLSLDVIDEGYAMGSVIISDVELDAILFCVKELTLRVEAHDIHYFVDFAERACRRQGVTFKLIEVGRYS